MANETSCFWRAAYGLKMLIITLLVRRGIDATRKKRKNAESSRERETARETFGAKL